MAALNIRARKKARSLALQALYQWQLTENQPHHILAQFLAHPDNQDIDREYFKQLVSQAIAQVDEIDKVFSPFLDRDITEVSPIELAILRLSSFELQRSLEIPYKIILNEAIELAKTFGAEDSFRYINGVLDKVAAILRAAEMKT